MKKRISKIAKAAERKASVSIIVGSLLILVLCFVYGMIWRF